MRNVSTFVILAVSGSAFADIEQEADNRVFTFQEKVLKISGDAKGLGDRVPDELVVADFDGDRDLDIVLYDSGTVSWAENKGKARKFASHSFKGMSVHGGEAFAIADIDGDRKPDMIAADGKLKIYWNKGKAKNWKVKTLATKSAYNLAIGDVNGDGKPDVVSDAGDGVVAFVNKGRRGFVEMKITEKSCGYQPRIADFDGDGDNDLLTACYGKGWSVFLNNGSSWTRKQLAKGLDSDFMDVAVADFDGDGDLDFVDVPNDEFKRAKLSMWTNDGKAGFSRRLIINNLEGVKTGLERDRGYIVETGRLFAADVDRDGKIDLITVARAKARDKNGLIWWSQRGKDWVANHFSPVWSAGSYAGIGDVDGDGKIDVVTTRNSSDSRGKSSPVFWRNKTKGKRR